VRTCCKVSGRVRSLGGLQQSGKEVRSLVLMYDAELSVSQKVA